MENTKDTNPDGPGSSSTTQTTEGHGKRKVKFKIIDGVTTFNHLNKEFDAGFQVTGLYYNSNKKFSVHRKEAVHAFSMNLWRGRIWGKRKDGSRQLIRKVIN